MNRTLSITAVALLLLSACRHGQQPGIACVDFKVRCEGNVAYQGCELVGTAQRKDLLPSWAVAVHKQDCGARGQVCREPASCTNNPPEPCERERAQRCAAGLPASIETCSKLDDGLFWTRREPGCQGKTECVTIPSGVGCATTPLERCELDFPKRCEGPKHIVYCLGAAPGVAGYVVHGECGYKCNSAGEPYCQ